MNRRKSKKYIKKRHHKSYYDVRWTLILEKANKYINTKDIDSDGIMMIHIVDSRKGNLKHPKKVQLLSNLHVNSISTPCDQPIEITFSVATDYKLKFLEGISTPND